MEYVYVNVSRLFGLLFSTILFLQECRVLKTHVRMVVRVKKLLMASVTPAPVIMATPEKTVQQVTLAVQWSNSCQFVYIITEAKHDSFIHSFIIVTISVLNIFS